MNNTNNTNTAYTDINTDLSDKTLQGTLGKVPTTVITTINNLIVDDHIKGKILFILIVIITIFGTFMTSKMQAIYKWGIPTLICGIFSFYTFTDGLGIFVDL